MSKRTPEEIAKIYKRTNRLEDVDEVIDSIISLATTLKVTWLDYEGINVVADGEDWHESQLRHIYEEIKQVENSCNDLGYERYQEQQLGAYLERDVPDDD